MDDLAALPSRRNLYGCWGILMAMTTLSLWVGDPAADHRRLSLTAITALLAAASVKASQVLWVFLNLRSSTLTWKITFLAFLATIVVLVWGCAAIGVWLGR